MRPTNRFKRAYLILVDFVLPLPLTALLFFLWRQRTGSVSYAAYVLTLGVLFGYIFPGIGTNLLLLWKFNGPFRIGNYHLHHGFMYAPYLALVFYAAFNPDAPLAPASVLRTVLCGAFIQIVISCHHDIWAVQTGMIEVNNTPAQLKKSAVEIVTHYGVCGFGLIGASFGISCLLAYQKIMVEHVAGIGAFILLQASGLSIMGLAAVQYLIQERAHISWQWLPLFRRIPTPPEEPQKK